MVFVHTSRTFLRLNYECCKGTDLTEFTVTLADERGRVQEQSHMAATADELRARFTQAGFLVQSVKAKGLLGGDSKKKKVKLESFLIFNQQFLTLVRRGAADSWFARPVGEAAEAGPAPRAVGRRGRACEDRRVDLGGV